MNANPNEEQDMTLIERRTPRAVLAAGVAIVATLMMLALAQAAGAKEFEGKVVSKNTADRTFRLDKEHGGIVRIAVNDGTKYQRVDGFGGIEQGMRLEAIAQKPGSEWVASKVERRRPGSGGGGGPEDR
jgi:hypothetical protein